MISDEETFGDDVRDEVENDGDEYDTVSKQELIAFVKANPALYAKHWKEYAGKTFCKDLAWESIGRSLSHQMSGKDAAKIWYNIRQQFGRERRKVAGSLKGKSGQGIKVPYVPKWQLYSDCLFLADHIMPRKTASNYISNVKKTTNVGKASVFPAFIPPSSPSSSSSSLLQESTPSPQSTISVLSSQALSPQALSLQALSPQPPSPQPPSPHASSVQTLMFLPATSTWSTGVESLYSDDSASVSSIEDNKRKEAALQKPIPSSSSLNMNERSSIPVNASSQSVDMLKAIQKIPTKRIVPEPDQFAKRKKAEDNSLMEIMAKQSTVLTSFATKLEESLANSGQYTPSLSSSVDNPVLIAIGYALKSVPEEKRLECMLDLLQVIKSKYAQK